MKTRRPARSLGAVVVSVLLATAVLAAGFSAPAYAASASAATVELTGAITSVSGQPDETSAAVTLFHVSGQGYLSVDISAIARQSTQGNLASLTIAVPTGVDVGSDAASAFAGLHAYTLESGKPVVAVAATAASTSASPSASTSTSNSIAPTTSAMINQTPASTAVHKVFAVVVSPANVASAEAAPSQSPADVQLDVESADAYWRAQSNNRVGFELVGVSSWYQSAYSCSPGTPENFWNFLSEAQEVAHDELGYSDAFNNHLVMVFPSGTDCADGDDNVLGQATLGTSLNSGGVLWVNGTGGDPDPGANAVTERGELIQQLGHNMSLGDANLDVCDFVAHPEQPATFYSFNDLCPESERGDLAAGMGNGPQLGLAPGTLASPGAVRAGVWPSSAYRFAPQGQSTYVLNSVSTNSGLRAVVLDTWDITYYIEFRGGSAGDAQYSGMGCSTSVDTSETACGLDGPGVRIYRLGQQWTPVIWKGFPGDGSKLIARKVAGTTLTSYTAGQSFKMAEVQIKVNAISGGTATVTVNNQFGFSSGWGGLAIWCTLCEVPQNDLVTEYHVGDTLTGMLTNDWFGKDLIFQWHRNNVPISGATARNYTLTGADLGKYIKFSSKWRYDHDGSTYVSSPPVGSGLMGWALVEPGTIVGGTAAINAASVPFTASLVSWFTAGVTYRYQWLRNGSPITGATLAAYSPVAADNGTELSLKVTATKPGYTTVTVTTPARDYTLAGAGTLAISGTPQVGQELSVNELTYSTIDGSSSPTVARQWYRSGSAIAGATASSYLLTGADLGKVMSVRVLAHAEGYANNVTTPPATSSVVRGDIAGSYEAPVVTQGAGTLQLTVALPDGSITEPGVTLNRQWFRDGVAIPLATGATYTLAAADYGKSIKARVIVTKLNYNSVALASDGANYSVTALGAVSIDGTVRVGSTLNATLPGYTTSGDPASPAMAYQWFRDGVAIPLATASTYLTVAADYNRKLSVKATASVSEFVPSILVSPQSVVVAKGALSGDLADPTVVKNGATMVLTASLTAGSVTDSGVAVAYQWYRNGVAVTGATAATYHLTAADFGKSVTVRLVVSKLNYTSATLLSDPVSYSVAPSTVLPVITGVVVLGQPLALAARTYTADADTPTVAYQWLRDGVAIPTATADTYTPVTADVGHTVSVRVTASNSGYLPSISTSAATQKVGSFFFGDWDEPVTVTKVDATMILTAHPGATTPTPAYAYQWYRNGAAIALATGATFHLTAADYGTFISVRVIASKAAYTTIVATSAATKYSVVPEGALAINGVTQVGSLLSPEVPSYTAGGSPASPLYAYQWYRSGIAITGAAGTAATYTLVAADYGKKIQVRVKASVDGYLASSVLSAMTLAVAKGTIAGDHAVPQVSLDAPTMVLTAALPGGSVTESGVTTTRQWLRNGVAIVGATLPTYHLTAADYLKSISVRVTVTKLNYTSVVVTSENTNYSLAASAAPVIVGPVAIGSALTLESRYYTTATALPATPDLISYQWLRDGVAIAGATADTYTPVSPADLGRAISVRVTGSLAGYLPSISTSGATQKVAANYFTDWSFPSSVSKNSGTMTLTAVPGVATPTPTYKYQWYRNGVAIYLATGATFHLTAADYGKTINVRITASKATYTTVVGTSIPLNYSVTSNMGVGIQGLPRVGHELSPVMPSSYSTSEGVASPTFTYQWYRTGVAIPGATGATYTLVSADYGTRTSVRVKAAVPGFLATTSTSPMTISVAKGILSGSFAAPTVTSNPVTMKLTAALTAGSVTDSGIATAYQWYRNGVAIYLATGSSYTLTALDYGKEIKVRLIVSKSNYTSVALYSVPVIP